MLDYKCSAPVRVHELIGVTLILHCQYQVKILMETLNVLRGATEAPAVLTNRHALMINSLENKRAMGRQMSAQVSSQPHMLVS